MKKVLIITYYWPPAGGPGVQRVLKFAKYLPQFGWEPIILTVDNGNYPAIDEGLLDEVPKGLKVFKTKTLEPFSFYNRFQGKSKKTGLDTFTITKTNKNLKERLGALIRRYLFIPDARKGWRFYAVNKGIDLVKDEDIDVIFSSSPPHSLQQIASKVARKTKRPWVADFRDPWANAFWLDEKQQKGLAHKINSKKESAIFHQLDYFTTVSQGVLGEYRQKYSRLLQQSSLLYNGFDEDDFIRIDDDVNDYFTIRYVGTLANSQNPKAFLKVISELKDQAIKVEFWGKFDASISETVKYFAIEDRVSFHPYVAHKKAVELMQNSDMLLLVIPFVQSKGILTGKLYEYIATRKPIIGFGPKGSEAGDIIVDNNFGGFFSDEEGVKEFLLSHLKKYSEGTCESDVLANVEQFSRQFTTQKLAEIFDKLVP